MHPDCEECKQLWRKYGLATMIHIELDSKLRSAAIQKNAEPIESLTRETEGAEKNRTELLQLIRAHEASHLDSRAAKRKIIRSTQEQK